MTGRWHSFGSCSATRLLLLCSIGTGLRFSPRIPVGTIWERSRGPLPSTANCTVNWIEQPLDHFSWPAGASGSFKMRYYTYKDWWQPGGPVFFYAGKLTHSLHYTLHPLRTAAPTAHRTLLHPLHMLHPLTAASLRPTCIIHSAPCAQAMKRTWDCM